MRFAADATLGKLGRHLRAAGFDTLCQHENRQGSFFETIDAERVILTRTAEVVLRFQSRSLAFIRDNDPLLQMRQVVQELGIGHCDLRPFSRCLRCNIKLCRVNRETVYGRVPAYVWQRHETFHACGNCGRIYWAGSHHERMCRGLAAIFQQKDEKPHEC